MIILLIFIYFIIFLQCVCNCTINIESTNIPDEFISRFNTTDTFIKDFSENSHSYIVNQIRNSTVQCGLINPIYCKDNVCVCISDCDIKPFIELPDKNGHFHRYILVPYASYFANFTYESENNNETIHVSVDCKGDNQCFSNKCVNNACTYNANSDVQRCDVIYTEATIFSHSEKYINCGRMLGESCTKDTDCSSNICFRDGKCLENTYRPSDNQFMIEVQKFCLKAGIIILLLIIICCCCCFVRSHKKNSINNVKEKIQLHHK